MNENYNNDEIDFFDLFETLWGGKWLIGCIVVISTLLGFGYTKLSQPVYRASATYSVNVYSVAGQQICGVQDQMKCLSKKMNKSFLITLSMVGQPATKAFRSRQLSLHL